MEATATEPTQTELLQQIVDHLEARRREELVEQIEGVHP